MIIIERPIKRAVKRKKKKKTRQKIIVSHHHSYDDDDVPLSSFPTLHKQQPDHRRKIKEKKKPSKAAKRFESVKYNIFFT